MASDIFAELRGTGFTDVTLDQSDAMNADGWVLTGEFTELNPGSQAARVWVVFGAGRPGHEFVQFMDQWASGTYVK